MGKESFETVSLSQLDLRAELKESSTALSQRQNDWRPKPRNGAPRSEVKGTASLLRLQPTGSKKDLQLYTRKKKDGPADNGKG